MKEELPSIFRNCREIENENREISSKVNKIIEKSEKLYLKSKNYEKNKESELLGSIVKNDNVFIYGEGDGKFFNNEKLLKNSNHLSKMNGEVAYNAKGILIRNFITIDHEEGNGFKNDKHIKVESIINSMAYKNETLLKNIKIKSNKRKKVNSLNTII
jgi:hypothetical protein